VDWAIQPFTSPGCCAKLDAMMPGLNAALARSGGAGLCASRRGVRKELRADGSQSALVSERIQYLIGYTR
jgi:hypothetical protein